MKAWSAVSLCLVLACGPGAADEDAGTTEGADEVGETGESPCPDELPENGSNCEPQGLACSFGDSPVPTCRDEADCGPNGWELAIGSCSQPAEDCPAEPPESGTLECAAEGSWCTYESGVLCGCTACPGPCTPDPPHWFCSEAPSAGCPAELPNQGSPCEPGVGPCHYGTCSIGSPVNASCEGGLWTWVGEPCPL